MSPKKVLVVDDHSDTREICEQLLTFFGYRVYQAEDGLQAFDVAVDTLPDLILLDFLMPHSDGLQTLARLRAHESLQQTPIVLYTAAATEAEQLKAVEGIQRVLFKPVEATRVLQVVQELIGPAQSELLA